MKRGTVTSFLLIQSVAFGSPCSCTLEVEEISEKRTCKRWPLNCSSHVDPSSPSPSTNIVAVWEISNLGNRLVDGATLPFTSDPPLVQYLESCTAKLWVFLWLCGRQALFVQTTRFGTVTEGQSISFGTGVFKQPHIIPLNFLSKLLIVLDASVLLVGLISKMLQGSIADQDYAVPNLNAQTSTSPDYAYPRGLEHQYTQPHPSSSTSTSSPLEISDGSTLIAPQSMQLPAVQAYRNFREMVVALQDAALGSWIPHPLSAQEYYTFNQDTAQRLAKIRVLEDAQRGVPLGANPDAERSLLLCRIDYKIRFWRTFRVNHLPTEIMTNIFRFVVWAAPEPRAGVQWRLWLTWTCKHWRTVALQDSTIWSAIWFRDLPPFARSLAWVDRAGDAPLDIRVNDSTERKFTDEEMGSLMDRLCTKINSIRMLIIILEDWEPILTILDKLRIAATAAKATGVSLLIERFELHRSGSPYVQIGDGYQPSSLRHPLPLFGGVPTPKLTYFSINGVHVDWGRSHIHNLTTLDLRRMPLERSPELSQFRDILKNSPALYKLCLDGAGPQWHPEDICDYPPVQLSRLRILILADISLHYALYILHHIASPNVRDLTVMNLVGEDYAPLFGAMTARFPAVKILTLFSVETLHTPGAGRALVKWLHSMPLLSYLRIANIKRIFLDAFLYNPETFQRVSGSAPTVKIVCPHVYILEFQSMQPQLIADWGIVRSKIGAPLKKFYIAKEHAKKLSNDDKAALESIAELNLIDFGTITVEEEELLRA
ncbi:hypothetical protein BDZ94DRAFT_1243422 [Collybia nuda]|uniref:F-box domain-containing protein n=1 Tax=Collybia nuda TaxID=64659 RepID=A0A9P5YJQ4_9AGAR|nr:hypothetical protein BDZ94DRAFT_1243422 [Collybia nuda]